uniref:A-kinase anchoring protein 11 n=1 Tax=Cynoglossus semilaevis TaxID=244447 RepID=A0A3P8UM27_CYNSE
MELKEACPQCWLKAVCVLRHNPSASVCSQASVASFLGLLGCYMAGIRYALELQALHMGSADANQPEEDDTNQSVSSIEDDFVTALEHLEEDDTGDTLSAAPYSNLKKRDVASQTIPAHRRKKELSGSAVIISSFSKKCSAKHRSTVPALPSPQGHVSESEESDCSSPSPIIFLDEVGYQKSLLAKLDIPQVPGGPNERVEDSDSEVSEFFDSFDQFDDLEDMSSESSTLALPLENVCAPQSEKKNSESSSIMTGSKFVSRGCSTKGMNPHCFDQPTLPANVKKPTPLKPGSPYSLNSELPESPRPVQTPSEENGGPLFSPVSSSAFSPLVDSNGPLEYFWKPDEDGQGTSELRKPQDLCSLYKTYSDFASNLSKEILGSVCGYQSARDINDNKNLSCVCHKEFKNPSGYLMKLSEIQETVTVDELQKKSQSLKDGIQKFATDLVEMSLGSALRDLQKGVSSCTTTLCHLAARLTSSVFQMAFHEIGRRHAYVLKKQAINGLAGFLVGEAVSGALKEFLTVKKQIFHNTVTRFAADLAEELVFEGIMEVCQFSHPSTPLTPSDWSFGQHLEEEEEEEEEEEVVSSYASDLSESVIQEAFIELSQADVAFTSQAAISVSLENICYVSAESTGTDTCSTFTNQQVLSSSSASANLGASGEDSSCTVKKALITVSGMASCVPAPEVSHALSHFQDSEETCQTSSLDTPCTRPHRDASDSLTESTTSTQGHETQKSTTGEKENSTIQNLSNNMVGIIVTEACELITASKMKKSFGECADFFTKTIGSKNGSAVKQQTTFSGTPESPSKQGDGGTCVELDPEKTTVVVKAQNMTRHTLDVPAPDLCVQRKMSASMRDSSPSSDQQSSESPCTPPSTPQHPPCEVSNERQIKQFSKKLKSKLSKEFSPAPPPPTPHYLPEPDPGQTDHAAEKDEAEFLLQLMSSLSEEDNGNEEEEPAEGEGDVPRCSETGSTDWQDTNKISAQRLSKKEALAYAERLACHIVSMATEMDTLDKSEVDKSATSRGSGKMEDSVAQFSEQTLNSLWVYAGEVAGEVINDVKRIMISGQRCPHHRAPQRRSSECLGHRQTKDSRVDRLTEQWSSDLIASVFRSPPSSSSTLSNSSSGMSSEFPSCESVTDEYASYLIRVLKKEGGNRELVLDQYASRLAYRSIKLGLAHANRKIKLRSLATHPYSSKSLPNEWKMTSAETSPTVDTAKSPVCPSGKESCCCSNSDQENQRDYAALVNFAESLAHNITRDVTQRVHLPSARLPKSLTDSCLYKKSKHEDVAGNAIKNSFSCTLLSKDVKSRHYHSTGSLYDDGDNTGVMHVVEHYARKIVDDTLKMGLVLVGQSPWERQRTYSHDRHSHTQRLSEGTDAGRTLDDRTCRYCPAQECYYCSKHGKYYTHMSQKSRNAAKCLSLTERFHSLDIPTIHIDLDHRVAFAEEMVSNAMETAKRELSNTSLNADSGIGHDGTSYAESLTAEVMTSALSNICQAANASAPGRETTESTVCQQLSVGEDSLGSWSNLSFEDDNSSFLHLSDSNGNSSSWSSLGLEGEAGEERMSFSPSDSDNTEEKDTEVKEESSGTVCVERPKVHTPRTALLVLNSDVRDLRRSCGAVQQAATDHQFRMMLQWLAASVSDVPRVQLSPDRDLQQLPAIVQRLQERRWRVGELLHTLLRYCEENQSSSQSQVREESPLGGREPQRTPLFQWLLDHI